MQSISSYAISFLLPRGKRNKPYVTLRRSSPKEVDHSRRYATTAPSDGKRKRTVQPDNNAVQVGPSYPRKKYPSYGGGRKGGPSEVCDVCEDAQWREKGGGRQRLLFGRLPSPSRPLPRSLAWPQSPPHAKAGGGGGRRKFMTPDFDKLA